RGVAAHRASQAAPAAVQHGPPFFFQAEDGIRDFHVTGVQTCALPIFSRVKNSIRELAPFFNTYRMVREYTEDAYMPCHQRFVARSEERRVGKECRAGWGRHP